MSSAVCSGRRDRLLGLSAAVSEKQLGEHTSNFHVCLACDGQSEITNPIVVWSWINSLEMRRKNLMCGKTVRK